MAEENERGIARISVAPPSIECDVDCALLGYEHARAYAELPPQCQLRQGDDLRVLSEYD